VTLHPGHEEVRGKRDRLLATAVFELLSAAARSRLAALDERARSGQTERYAAQAGMTGRDYDEREVERIEFDNIRKHRMIMAAAGRARTSVDHCLGMPEDFEEYFGIQQASGHSHAYAWRYAQLVEEGRRAAQRGGAARCLASTAAAGRPERRRTMRYTLFGSTGLRVSEIALGALTFDGEDSGCGVPKKVAARILDAYAEAGGNFIDTADALSGGRSETVLGELLAGRRDEFVLATTFSSVSAAGGLNAAGSHRRNLVAALDASLRRLRTDYIDVLWVHARDAFTPVDEVMRALDDQVTAGKALYVAVSDWPAWEVAEANTLARLRGWSPFAGLQARYSLLDRTAERELLPMAESFDLPVLAWSPLAAGRLAGRYPRGGPGRLGRPGEDGCRGENWEDAVVRTVAAIAREGGWTPAQVAVAWLLHQPGAVIPLVCATSERHVTDLLGAAGVRLDAEQLARLDEVSRVPLGFPHDFLNEEAVRNAVYGPRWREIDDRRTTCRRSLAG
jgi:aryl-alcohol dehydrogenase-like predicted oxidoreductase